MPNSNARFLPSSFLDHILSHSFYPTILVIPKAKEQFSEKMRKIFTLRAI